MAHNNKNELHRRFETTTVGLWNAGKTHVFRSSILHPLTQINLLPIKQTTYFIFSYTKDGD